MKSLTPFKPKAPRGTRDLLPEDMILFRYVESKLRSLFESFGFKEVQTPIFESFNLFALRSGDEIRNSMFVFETGEGEMALRPELTAPICRLIVEGKISTANRPIKLYYIGRAFRYEEPQAGRYREFWQAGVELIGSKYPEADAEIICLATSTLNHLGLSNYRLELGDVAVLRSYMTDKGIDYEAQNKVLSAIDHLRSTLRKLQLYKETLSQEPSQRLLKELKQYLYNTIEIRKRRIRSKIGQPNPQISKLIDSLKPETRIYKLETLTLNEVNEIIDQSIEELKVISIINWCYQGLRTSIGIIKLPLEVGLKLLETLKLRGEKTYEIIEKAKETFKDSQLALKELERLSEVVGYLEDLNIKKYILDIGLARGLEYYTGIVFEIHIDELGAQSQVCGGGRYDKLIAEFGGPNIPSVGFAFGIDRLILALKKKETKIQHKLEPVYIVPLSEKLRKEALRITALLRNNQIPCQPELMRRNIRRALSHANKTNIPIVLIIAPKEYNQGKVIIKNMKEGTQELIDIKDLAEHLKKIL